MPKEVATLLPDVLCVPASALRSTGIRKGKAALITGTVLIGISTAMQDKMQGLYSR